MNCLYCWSDFTPVCAGNLYCGPRCADRARSLRDRIRIMVRDRGICQLCGTPVDITRSPNDPDGPTMDHKVARAVKPGRRRGQDQVWLAHKRCNEWRSDMPLATWERRGKALAASFYRSAVSA